MQPISLQPWEITAVITLFLALCGAIAAVVRFLWKLDTSVKLGAQSVEAMGKSIAALATVFEKGIEALTERADRTDGRIDELWKAFAAILPKPKDQ